jgi:RHS repeat-associated protein
MDKPVAVAAGVTQRRTPSIQYPQISGVWLGVMARAPVLRPSRWLAPLVVALMMGPAVGQIVPPTAHLIDGFNPSTDYRPESIRGTTPFSGVPLKATLGCLPGGEGARTVNLANGEFVARFSLLQVRTELNNGQVVSRRFDSLNRLLRVEVTPAPETIGTRVQTYAYDGLGRIVSAYDDGLLHTGIGDLNAIAKPSLVAYDSLGRVVGEEQHGFTLNQTRDGVGNILETRLPNNRIVERTYDILDRVESIFDAKGMIAEFDYQGPRRLAHIEKAAGALAQTIDYDLDRRVQEVRHSSPSWSSPMTLTYLNDDAGNRLAVEKSYHSSASELTRLDSLYRMKDFERGNLDPSLTSITMPSPDYRSALSITQSGTNAWEQFSVSDYGGPSITYARTHNSANQVLTEGEIGVPPTAFEHDPNGNLKADADFAYYYDFQNRLVRIDDLTTDEAVAGFGYDAFGRRVVKIGEHVTVTPPPPLTMAITERKWTWSTYAGWDVVQEVNGTVSSLSPGPWILAASLRQYDHGPRVDEVVSMSWDTNGNGATTDPADARYYLLHDAQLSTIAVADAGPGLLASVVEGYMYDPFGRVYVFQPGPVAGIQWSITQDEVTINGESGPGNPWLFTGRYHDPGIGLYYYRARHYDSDLGQFMSRDPIGIWGDASQLGNPYSYVSNRPWTMTDPMGLSCTAAQLGGQYCAGSPQAKYERSSIDSCGTAGCGPPPCNLGPLAGGRTPAQKERDCRNQFEVAMRIGDGAVAVSSGLADSVQLTASVVSMGVIPAPELCGEASHAYHSEEFGAFGECYGAVLGFAAQAVVATPMLARALPVLGRAAAAPAGTRALVGCGIGSGFYAAAAGPQGSAAGYAGSCIGGAVAAGLPGGTGLWSRVLFGARNGLAGGFFDAFATQAGNYVVSGRACSLDGSNFAFTMASAGVGGALAGASTPRLVSTPNYGQQIYDGIAGATVGAYGLPVQALQVRATDSGSCAR